MQQQFARSITLENAMKPEPLLAWALNGQPLRRDHGFPLRVIMPGWYGVANVKWLSEIHLQENRFLGNYQARWYRTVRAVGGTGDLTDPETQFIETEVTRLNLKSVIARVRKMGGVHRGARLRAERWHAAPLGGSEGGRRSVAARRHSIRRTRSTRGNCSPIRWEGATPGEHTIVSRVTDANGHGPADRRRTGAQEDVPRGQLAVPAQGDDCVVGHRMRAAASLESRSSSTRRLQRNRPRSPMRRSSLRK